MMKRSLSLAFALALLLTACDKAPPSSAPAPASSSAPAASASAPAVQAPQEVLDNIAGSLPAAPSSSSQSTPAE